VGKNDITSLYIRIYYGLKMWKKRSRARRTLESPLILKFWFFLDSRILSVLHD
jgi:hypothetical protein